MVLGFIVGHSRGSDDGLMVDNWVDSQLVGPGFFLAAKFFEEFHDGETQGYSREFLSDMWFGTFLCCGLVSWFERSGSELQGGLRTCLVTLLYSTPQNSSSAAKKTIPVTYGAIFTFSAP